MPALAILALLALFLVTLVVIIVVVLLRRPLPQVQGTVHLPGLKGRTEVIRDRWGVPHIYAGSSDDLFFAQGFVHAQDRLWQMELQRRAGSGRLSEVIGQDMLEVDRFFRVVGLNRAARAELAAMDDDSRRILEAYSAGVNAYMEARRGRLGIEFGLLRFQPEPWQAIDVLHIAKLLAWTLSGNLPNELIRARLAARLGAERAADLDPPFPADNPAIVPASPAAGDHEPPPNGWGSQALRDALVLVEGLFAPRPPAMPPSSAAGPVLPATGGSNQWVVSGALTATGRPLLANDTHLQLSMPAAWYEIHLAGGDYDVTGVSFPGTPGVVVGHNAHCAWGLTTAWQDVQDLYVEKLNPENPYQYEYRGAWCDAEVVREEIVIKGQDEPLVQPVTITRHGPIISEVVGETTPLALRWVGLEPSNLLRSVLRYDCARNWDEFREALKDWSVPAHNFVYADVEGNIGYLQAGWMPVRARGYGLAPVPGWTGEYEWQGYLSLDDLPQAYNPEAGWLATANHLVVDGSYPHFLSGDLENPCRARRVVDLITSKQDLSADDFARFQRDIYSAQAERLSRHLVEIEPANEEERRALEYLAKWDHQMESHSVAASIYQVTRLRALVLTFGPHLGDLIDDYVGLDTITPLAATTLYHGRSMVRLLDLLDGQGENSWLAEPASGRMRSREEILHLALAEALDLLRAELGPDMATWTWGRLNRLHFQHPVGAVNPLHLLFNRGPFAMGGDQDTLLRASSAPRYPFPPVGTGDAVRFIADVSDWEQCRLIIPGGQSGHVASRHYADLIPLWREGRYQAMPFGRAQIERDAKQHLTLAPAGTEPAR
jgi:penicillin amidase